MAEGTLVIDQVSVRFGGITALSELSLRFDRGVSGVIGPNGAGKSTLFNVMTGLVRPTEGRVTLDGTDISRRHSDGIARLGLRRTFQNIRLFADQSVLDNVAVGAVATGNGRRSARQARRAAADVLDRVGLGDALQARPYDLPYESQRRVEIARCLVARPKTLLLDEPAAGMHATQRNDLAELIADLGRQLTVVLVEHDIALVSRVCAQLTVIEFGRVIVAGSPDEVRNDPRVIDAYLGSET